MKVDIRLHGSESSRLTDFGVMPDSTYDDTTAVEESFDTSYAYSDGGDSIYVLADSLFNDSTTADTTSIYEGRLTHSGISNYQQTTTYAYKTGAGIDPIACIPLFDGSTPELINQGLYGINVSGMFDNATCPNDGSATDQWQWLSDLRPEVLRFPHGANGKFMHLLHDVSTGDTAVGYGYNLAELIRYFDASDNDFTDLVPTIYPDMATAIAAISLQSDANIPEWNSWMDHDLTGQFSTFLSKWQVQQELSVSPTDHSNYLTDFIQLVRQIETDNPGHTVKVIVCLNILSETSTECAAIVQFLRSNPLHNVTVVGVELGNECPNDFHWKTMGFAHFSEHPTPAGCDPAFNGSYWSFINGDAYTTTQAQTRLGLFLNPAMQLQDATGHYYNRDFIKAFKYNFTTNCKIGLPGDATPNDQLTPIPEVIGGADCASPDNEWNTDLVDHYGDEIATLPPGLPKKKFDAVILHVYLNDKQNWELIANELDPPYTSGRWEYLINDIRLQPAFVGIMFFDPSNPDDYHSDSFMGFIKYGHKVAWDDYRYVFNFTPTSPTDKLRKELWMTEYNIKINGEDPLLSSIYNNGFTHGFLLQEWFLKNLKVNYAGGYKKNFFTYATFQNYAGANEDMITPADRPRELYNYLCMDYAPYNLGGANPNQRSYHMKRTSYFIMSMLKEITAEDLKYVRTKYITTSGNINAAPTMFIDPGKDYLYMYFSNSKATEQDYLINGENLAPLFEPMPIISFGDATIRLISAQQLYSNSGNSTLFDPLINTGYTNPTPGDRTCYDGEVLPPDYLYPIEIQTAYFTPNMPDCANTPATIGGCITVPPYSIGYVKIPILQNYRFAETATQQNGLTLYPNPAKDWFTYTYSNFSDATTKYKIEIYSITGTLLSTNSTSENNIVDISEYPSGVYLIKVYRNEETLAVKTLIKTN